jgi:hypothetical protein
LGREGRVEGEPDGEESSLDGGRAGSAEDASGDDAPF